MTIGKLIKRMRPGDILERCHDGHWRIVKTGEPHCGAARLETLLTMCYLTIKELEDPNIKVTE